jgi:hypothetical protein
VKTRASRECAELFSPFSSFDCDCQCCSFPIQRNRDKISTRKFDVGVFTQAGPICDICRARNRALPDGFNPYQSSRLSRKLKRMSCMVSLRCTGRTRAQVDHHDLVDNGNRKSPDWQSRRSPGASSERLKPSPCARQKIFLPCRRPPHSDAPAWGQLSSMA